ncbi:hypothetical protein HBA54_26275 [Pelagibius litoralis]|uniref:Uncharacterized protein n=1 Tax=Pelagibius litoralis TaxID=374515 RepID=A0A967KBC1_9PROT|nr:DUF6522 family protein [Pelagibius litoralis]NIA72103.1 hypothetical protein [Pelagibius litoralis]
MTRLPATSVIIVKGQITIEADLLAPKLGLSVDGLKDNMVNGLVTSIAETGVGEDAGRTRLTFRYRARTWRVVVDIDGTLKEDPVSPPEPRAAKDRSSLLDLMADP